jgi:hypothetical protein
MKLRDIVRGPILGSFFCILFNEAVTGSESYLVAVDLALWLLTRQINNKELNWIELNYVSRTYTITSVKLGLQPLRGREHYLVALFFVQVYRGLKSCTPPPMENVSLRIPPSNLREFSVICSCPSNKHCPSARCAYAANVVRRDLDIFALGSVSLNWICAPNREDNLILLLLCYHFFS